MFFLSILCKKKTIDNLVSISVFISNASDGEYCDGTHTILEPL
jgi:hypothetical protein